MTKLFLAVVVIGGVFGATCWALLRGSKQQYHWPEDGQFLQDHFRKLGH